MRPDWSHDVIHKVDKYHPSHNWISVTMTTMSGKYQNQAINITILLVNECNVMKLMIVDHARSSVAVCIND